MGLLQANSTNCVLMQTWGLNWYHLYKCLTDKTFAINEFIRKLKIKINFFIMFSVGTLWKLLLINFSIHLSYCIKILTCFHAHFAVGYNLITQARVRSWILYFVTFYAFLPESDYKQYIDIVNTCFWVSIYIFISFSTKLCNIFLF